ncbi:flagellar biosynthesis protein FlgB [Stakelama sp. CBK3Z-3]|uniref:Flagellar biosynthesis protein FlgB n=1 Tax=Stakelama flava TaxID=2860338 RepID=A0ABS6XJT6_9SPHN|nr:flagellar biosynthesis protein FlgB [Stakelama flava]MBW4330472.1 flagellar biosynthesis protein FlgB [Stakelama flava]
MTDLIAGIGKRMHFLSDRQRVIAENVANSETPAYKAREVDAPDFSDLVQTGGGARVARPRVALTSAMTALGANPSLGGSNIVLDAATSETKPDGNNVTLEDQLLKMGEVQADFATMTSLYRKSQALMKTALGQGSRG